MLLAGLGTAGCVHSAAAVDLESPQKAGPVHGSSEERLSMKKKVFHYVLLVILAVMIGSGLYSLNASRLTGDQIPMPFGIGGSVVLSGSMEPALSVGDLLIVREAPAYHPGDVVVYQSGRMPVVHRILSMDGEFAVTQGDANNAPDEPVALSAIKGRVVLSVPLVGYAFLALKTPVGIIVAVAAAVLLVEGSFRSNRKEKEDEQEKLKAEIRALMDELKED